MHNSRMYRFSFICLLSLITICSTDSAESDYDLFVSLYCKYGQNELQTLYKPYFSARRKNVTIHPIVRLQKGIEKPTCLNDFYCLYGDDEVADSARLCLLKSLVSDSDYERYISSWLDTHDWKEACKIVGLIPEDFNETALHGEGPSLLFDEARLCDFLHVDKSPTIYVNGILSKYKLDVVLELPSLVNPSVKNNTNNLKQFPIISIVDKHTPIYTHDAFYKLIKPYKIYPIIAEESVHSATAKKILRLFNVKGLPAYFSTISKSNQEIVASVSNIIQTSDNFVFFDPTLSKGRLSYRTDIVYKKGIPIVNRGRNQWKNGLFHYLKGNIDESEIAFKEAVQFNPHDTQSINNLGVLYMDVRKNYSDAIYWFKEGLKIESDDRRLKTNLAKCQTHIAESTPTYEEWTQSGEYWMNVENWQSAQIMFERALAIREGIKAKSGLAESLFRLGEFDDAYDLFEELSNERKVAYPALIRLGDISLNKKFPKNAIDWYKKAKDVNPKNVAPYLGIAQGLAFQNKCDEVYSIIRSIPDPLIDREENQSRLSEIEKFCPIKKN